MQAEGAFPSGIGSVVMLLVAGMVLSKKIDVRWLIATGLIVMATGNYSMSQMNLQVNPCQIICTATRFFNMDRSSS